MGTAKDTSKKPGFPERDTSLPAHDDVVEQPHADRLRGRGEAARELPVFARRRRVARGMVVVQDHGGGLPDERAPQDLARLDDRAVERAAIDVGVVLAAAGCAR